MASKAPASPPGEARIGPNAVLQTIAAIEARLGAGSGAAILAEAGLEGLPDGTDMIREADAIALHRAIARRFPREGPAIAREAGRATADYIIAHRIPGPAKALLRLLPATLAAPLLMAAIRRHAWTFVGAGHFAPAGGWDFTIDRALAGDDPAPPPSLFTWYGAVFTRLFGVLVASRSECRRVEDPNASEEDGLACRYHIARERDVKPARALRDAPPAALRAAPFDQSREGRIAAP